MAERRLLVVDDESDIRKSIELTVRRHGFEVLAAGNAAEALALLDRAPDVVILDLFLGSENGKDLLQRLREAAPLVPVIMISGQGSVDDALDCVRAGAFDWIQKPLHPGRLLVSLENAASLRAARGQVIGRILPVSAGPAMARAVGIAEKVSQTRSAVLLTGESGTGKDLMAQLIHSLSPRAAAPLVRINCGAIPESLVESELFGHRKGSFTGADRDSSGKLQAADGGTLFLDEVGDLPLSAQVKLLRFLESGEIQRIGETAPVKADVRVLAATNRDLRAGVEAGAFRADLYYRLAVIELRLPPLRERREDIPALVEHFAASLSSIHGLPPPRFSQDAMAALCFMDYPGNVRELRNLVERTIILNAPATLIGPADLVAGASGTDPLQASPFSRTMPLSEAKRWLEASYIRAQLAQRGGSLKATAAALGLLPSNLSRRMRELGMEEAGGGA